MTHRLNIRTNVILAISLFTLTLYALIQYRYSDNIHQQLIDSEIARNTLLVETVLPVLKINLTFDLHEANREYLDNIVRNNPNILDINLTDNNGQALYAYHHPDRAAIRPIDMLTQQVTLYDELTQERVGSIEVHFSYLYFNQLMEEHIIFSIKLFVVIVLLLLLFIYYLNRTFRPLKELQNAVELFEPSGNRFTVGHIDPHNEVAIIQNALVEMVERVNLYTFELDEAARMLEQKIEERTEELQQQKEQIESSNRELARTVEQLREQEKMLIAQSRLAAMGEMMSMIAHQWRQPLATMSLMIANYNMKAMIEGKEKDDRDRIMNDISSTLSYLSETVDDFQTYFKPTNIVETSSICTILERAIQFTRVRMEYKQITLNNSCTHDYRVHTYTNEMVQVLINIINNAIDAITLTTPEKKVITIETDEEEAYIIIRISDTGGGIDAAIIDRIFEPYFSTKSKNGTGLGLYMAKMIISKHSRGQISVENLGDGSRFTITLPKEPLRAPDAPSSSE